MSYQNPYMPNWQYNPSYTTASGPYNFAQQQPVHGFVYVTGLDGAKAYQMPPNSEMPLFDDSADILYIKTTDGAGFPTITIADCTKRDSQPMGRGDVVTRDDITAIHNEIEQLRSAIHELVSTAAATAEPADESTARHSADGGR